jgi:hypothetical protein
VKARHEEALLQIPGVVGVGVGLSPDTGEAVIQVYTAGPMPQTGQAIPPALEGIRVQVIEAGEFTPYSGEQAP